MTPEEAEAKICELIGKIAGIHAQDLSEADREAILKSIDDEVFELKKITGPRNISVDILK